MASAEQRMPSVQTALLDSSSLDQMFRVFREEDLKAVWKERIVLSRTADATLPERV